MKTGNSWQMSFYCKGEKAMANRSPGAREVEGQSPQAGRCQLNPTLLKTSTLFANETPLNIFLGLSQAFWLWVSPTLYPFD